MYDAALYYGNISSQRSDIINRLKLIPDKYVIGTIHRQENTDNIDNLKSIISALNTISKSVQVVLPLHPRTHKIMDQNAISLDFNTIEPVGYFDMVELLKNSCMVITDSGGMQKEAYFFDKYCITLRNETEWIELVDNGFNYLAGPVPSKIISLYQRIKTFTDFKKSGSLYGNGKASIRIIDYLISYLT